MQILTDRLITETVMTFLIVDGYPPTTGCVANALRCDEERVLKALVRAQSRSKVVGRQGRWVPEPFAGSKKDIS